MRVEMRSIRHLLTGGAALLLATGAANAGEKCDTTHTSDLRGIWQCGDICIHRYGNPANRSFQISGMWNKTTIKDNANLAFVFRGKTDTVIINGKRCKELKQTYDYGGVPASEWKRFERTGKTCGDGPGEVKCE
jgi:hypothetical protein